MANSPTLMTLGPALLPAINGKGLERKAFLPVCATTKQTRGGDALIYDLGANYSQTPHQGQKDGGRGSLLC
jgi:fatty acid/phospholipid biosynthesis enzyme